MFCNEDIQDVPTEELLEKFGSDPRPSNRSQKLFCKEGNMFLREEEPYSHYPRRSSFIPSQCKGELIHSLEAGDTSTLCFNCYSVNQDEWDEEIHRIRNFKFYYHLADHTASMFEPYVENSGYMQGRIFYRQKIPSSNRLGGPYLHWRDLNVGIDITIFGKDYRITSCDKFTKKFLEEHGIKLNEMEIHPEDPWTTGRRRQRGRNTPKVNTIIPKTFIPWPQQLHFRCCWNEENSEFYGHHFKRTFHLTVFTVDDTVTLTEETKEYEGQLFLRRIILPKPKEQDGICRYYRSSDFHPGVWIDVFSRKMFIYECLGEPTKEFMSQQFGEIDFRNCSNEILNSGPPPLTFEQIPNELRFLAKMIDPLPTLVGLDFILTYDVNTKKVTIKEAGKQRRWATGRSFLEDVDASTFSENQFNTGLIVQFFNKWRFKLVEGDRKTNEYLHWREQR